MLVILPFFAQKTAAQTTNCQYTIILTDSYGDGWNGGVLTVTSGTQITPFTLLNGYADTLTFDVFNGVPCVLLEGDELAVESLLSDCHFYLSYVEVDRN